MLSNVALQQFHCNNCTATIASNTCRSAPTFLGVLSLFLSQISTNFQHPHSDVICILHRGIIGLLQNENIQRRWLEWSHCRIFSTSSFSGPVAMIQVSPVALICSPRSTSWSSSLCRWWWCWKWRWWWQYQLWQPFCNFYALLSMIGSRCMMFRKGVVLAAGSPKFIVQ